ncbi:MAG: bifunctional phosphoribosyl-AMP cyclohydrolase/phosphoribosyl-ATP pyrophosphatase, partial [Clostridia bacterium]|nr:bifunctional phosphoribosyl-AMP cyclohydrolase/phosphoribosyl-ATP pyrophosphatase [Clostridia bacterium]
MKLKKVVPCIYLKNKTAIKGFKDDTVLYENPVDLALNLYHMGAEELVVFDLSNTDQEHDEALGVLRQINRNIDIPVTGAGNIKRVEDVKKIIYAGCQRAALNMAKQENMELLEEVSKRFGKEKISACADAEDQIIANFSQLETYCSCVVLINDILCDGYKTLPLLQVQNEYSEIVPAPMEGAFKWNDFKLNSDGHVPVIVQDYKTSKVLMMAYMNQEAYEKTLETGKMTYYSRSRNTLWLKGETSGHFQYVKELTADCDMDTILAKVA